jgi:hypothetical protein
VRLPIDSICEIFFASVKFRFISETSSSDSAFNHLKLFNHSTMALRSVDNPAVLDAFLKSIRPRKSVIASSNKLEDVGVKLDPRIKVSLIEFSMTAS